jgi:TetR/AcrR family transcriptional repressor of nem operon
MRYTADHKEKTRRRILDAASVVFRRKGFQGGSVDDVMAEAGLTAGGFYAHFSSKDELFAEAMRQAITDARVIRGADDESRIGAERIRSITRKYLSRAHRAMVEEGCMMPPLLAELARQDEPARRGFEQKLVEIAKALEPHVSAAAEPADPDRAYAILATLIGGMTLARAAADEKLSDRILAACRRLINDSLDDSRTAFATRKKGARRTRSARKSSHSSKTKGDRAT